MGDLFNYDAPGREPSDLEDKEILSSNSSVTNVDNSDAEELDSHSQRLTDGGFEEDVNSYCFYARVNYKQGEQVFHNSLHSNFHILSTGRGT